MEGELDVNKYSVDVLGLLEEVYSVYGQFSALRLRSITHEEPPWMNTPQGDVIPLEAMKDYFRTQVTK